MSQNDYEQRIAAMSEAELRCCLELIVRAYKDAEPLPYYHLRSKVNKILKDWNLNPFAEE